ncbi:MAG: LysM peptidoglycan-binding domain-containing protein [Deltaproteobacteria bacterium]|nr:LysM peptidoglycan-binding domain-containing protein [Deltaproteobacteria bacterium]
MHCLKSIHFCITLALVCCCVPVCLAQTPEAGAPQETSPAGIAFVDSIPLPESVTLCGEPVPIERQAVRERFDREFTINVWDRAQVFLWLKRANRYFPYIEQQLAAAGLPEDLKYLAIAESSLLNQAQSPVGATGYWQFMPKTADSKGLRRDGLSDERYSLEHSTAAALRYLKEYYDSFGSWALAMAAYNCGGQRVRQAIKKQKVADYYRLKLPNETERYIFRIAAIKTILENPGKYGYRIAHEQLYPVLQCDVVAVNTPSKINIPDLAIAAGTDYKTIRDLNPHFNDYYLPAGSYTIKVPAGLGPQFSKQLARSAASRTQSAPRAPADDAYYTVRPGDTLSHIAERTGVPVKRLQELNGLKGATIRPGQKLKTRP